MSLIGSKVEYTIDGVKQEGVIKDKYSGINDYVHENFNIGGYTRFKNKIAVDMYLIQLENKNIISVECSKITKIIINYDNNTL